MEETTKTAYRDLLNDTTATQREKYSSLYALRRVHEEGPLKLPMHDEDLETLLRREEYRGTVEKKAVSRWIFFTDHYYAVSRAGYSELISEKDTVRKAQSFAQGATEEENDDALRNAGYQPHDIAMRALILEGEFDDVPPTFFSEPKLGTRVAKRLRTRDTGYARRRSSSSTPASDDALFWPVIYASDSGSSSSDSGSGSSSEFSGGGGSFGGAGASASWAGLGINAAAAHQSVSPHYDSTPSHSYDSGSSHSDSGSSHSCSSSSSSCSSGSSCGGGGCGGGGD